MFWVLKRTVSEINDAKTFCYHLLLFGESSSNIWSILYSIMFDNLYVKHNISNLVDENS